MLQIVFSDLDGTLLDHRTYDYSPALPALAKLQEKQIPLVFCTRKTAAEMIPFRKEIKNKDPFIVENGGGIYIPNPHSIAPLADEFPGGHRAHTPGPKGWNDAVLSLLETEPIEKGKLTG